MYQKKHLSVHMRRGETISGLVYFPFYLFGISFLLTYLFAALGRDVNDPYVRTQLNLCYFAINMLVVAIAFRRFLIASLHPIGKRFWGFVQAVILAYVMYYVGTVAVRTILLLIYPDFQNLNNAAVADLASNDLRTMVLCSVFLGPIVEETLFRGVVFSNLHHFNRGLAYAASCLLFAVLHVYSYIGQAPAIVLFFCLLEYLPAGIALGWAYEKSDTIWAPIVTHALVNAVSMGMWAALF